LESPDIELSKTGICEDNNNNQVEEGGNDEIEIFGLDSLELEEEFWDE